MPEGFGSQWQDITNIHPLGLAAVLILGAAMLVLPRRWAILPMIIIACFIPSVQKVVLLSLDFNLLRIMVLFGVTRLWIRGEGRDFKWKTIDKVMVYYCVSATLILTIRTGSFSAFVNRLGFSFDAIGMYFLFRCLIRTWQDIDRLVLGCIVVSIPVAIAFAVEHATARNVFSIFGGVPEVTPMRQGKLRCQGAFPHPILAGCFWAALVPLFVSQWWRGLSGKIWAIIGVVASVFIIFTCNSSTPVLGLIGAIVGGVAIFCRYRMHEIRWGVVITLTVLHLIMTRPVWGLVAIASAVGGGTGWHRYMLINGAIRHFGEWWLLGTRSTAHWGWGAQDITNQYVLEAVRGGLLTLGLFIAVIVLAFQGVGRSWRLSSGDRYQLAVSWALGVSLFVHCMQFIGVSYFGEVHIVWFLTLGMIGSLSPATTRSPRMALEIVPSAC
jgi:hypothetical protein